MRARLIELPYPRPFVPSWAPEGSHRVMSAVVVEVETEDGVIGVSGGDMGHGTGPMLLEAIRTWLRPSWWGWTSSRRQPSPTGCATWPSTCSPALGGRRGGLGRRGQGVRAAAVQAVGRALLADTGVRELRRSARQRGAGGGRAQGGGGGFTGLKLRVHAETIAEDVAQVAAVREAVGPDVALMVDANQAAASWRYRPDGTRMIWDYTRALTSAREFADLGVAWLEEPLGRHDYRSLRELTAVSPIPIAGGEHNRGLGQLVRLLEDDCFSIFQPDANESEEIGTLRMFGMMAAARQRKVIPHAWATGLGVAGNLQLCASLPNCDWLEYPYDPGDRAGGLPRDAHQAVAAGRLGNVSVPEGPGLGVELDHAAIESLTTQQV
ncbi:enolase C-terminal domain-like protein [Streptomyces sp. M10(2022)]